MTAETDITAIDTGGANTAAEVRTALTSTLKAHPYSFRHIAQRIGTSAHTDDEEFDGTLGGTAVTPTGTVTWTRDSDLNVLSAHLNGVAEGDLAGRLWSMTPTTSPVTLETAVRLLAMNTPSASYPFAAGLVFADGTATTSNVMLGAPVSGAIPAVWMRGGTFANLNGTSNLVAGYGSPGIMFARLIWSAANTFKVFVSPSGADGSWTKLTLPSTYSKTMTPTHFGLGVTQWGIANDAVATFEYLRVYESDLSA